MKTMNEIHINKKTNLFQSAPVRDRLWKAFSGRSENELLKNAFEDDKEEI